MLARDGSEADFQSQITDLARHYGWFVFHPSPHRVGASWRTDGAGFPDLVLAHTVYGVIFAELKTEQGKLSHLQNDWRQRLEPHVEYYCWRPSMLRSIANRLGGGSWN